MKSHASLVAQQTRLREWAETGQRLPKSSTGYENR